MSPVLFCSITKEKECMQVSWQELGSSMSALSYCAHQVSSKQREEFLESRSLEWECCVIRSRSMRTYPRYQRNTITPCVFNSQPAHKPTQAPKFLSFGSTLYIPSVVTADYCSGLWNWNVFYPGQKHGIFENFKLYGSIERIRFYIKKSKTS